MAGCADGAAVDPEAGTYRISYLAELQPEAGRAQVEIRVDQQQDLLRVLDFNAPASTFSGFEGDGDLDVSGDRAHWSVPARGGSLRYQVTIDHLRGDVHDARITDDWAVFRLDDLFPAARTRAMADSAGEATLRFSGPPGWRFETPYGPSSEPVHTLSRDRLFPRPVGWAVAGRIGVRRDLIVERPVAVAAPVDQGFRRQDILAFLHWTMPALIEVFPCFPERLLIVGSGRDMWRGGLSAPGSLYLHPDRPLISGNGTSTLLHELVHLAVRDVSGEPDDWLVEGLAEYYSLDVLRRSGGISQRRFDAALASLEAWADRESGRLAHPSTGPDTAYAVLVLHDLAGSLEQHGESLDTVVHELLDRGLNAGELEAVLAGLGVDHALPLPDSQGAAE